MTLVGSHGQVTLETASTRRFSAAIDCYPAAFGGNPLNLLLLDDAHPILETAEYLRRLDAPELMEERREYVRDACSQWPFPTIQLGERPDPWEVSLRLFDRFQDVGEVLTTQSDISSIVIERAKALRADVVALMIVDGLSYFDLPAGVEAEPCLVKGPSLTGFGYRAVVGDPPLARSLFALGYKTQYGYTYYSPDSGSLAEELFDLFASTQIIRIRSFDEVLKHLRDRSLVKAYLQIHVTGLDHLSHFHHDRPPRDHYLAQVMQRWYDLLDCLAGRGRRVLACMTADHGILWRDAIEQPFEVVDDLLPEDAHSPRYIRRGLLRQYARICTTESGSYTLLRVPYLARGLKATEWGVHGGISAWESLVPLLVADYH